MRPEQIYDSGVQHERTALAWERTAIATIVAGLLFARAGAELGTPFAVPGVAQVVVGATLLVWAGRHYDDLHGPLRVGESPVHPRATRAIGLVTMTASATALAVVVAIAL